nr:probable receptor-like protein kinase At1g80640 [Ipomoea batatas]
MNICPKAHTGSSPTEKEPIFQASASTCVHSPGATDVRAVQHQNLNKKILIALIVASTLLGGILLLLSGLWVYRLSKLKKSNEKWQQNAVKSTPFKASGRKGLVAVLEYPSLLAILWRKMF